MNHDYKKQATRELAEKIKAAGFRVFLAERGTHGFYTDAEGSRVVSFQYDLAGFRFSGNYKTDQPRSTGTGWDMGTGRPGADKFARMFESGAPRWAVGSANWKHTTLMQYRAMYQRSSKFVEVGAEEAQ